MNNEVLSKWQSHSTLIWISSFFHGDNIKIGTYANKAVYWFVRIDKNRTTKRNNLRCDEPCVIGTAWCMVLSNTVSILFIDTCWKSNKTNVGAQAHSLCSRGCLYEACVNGLFVFFGFSSHFSVGYELNAMYMYKATKANEKKDTNCLITRFNSYGNFFFCSLSLCDLFSLAATWK